ncbi:MAG: 3-keto-disaccharide hydrolase, partial [Verrucomicrobiales bacterium]
MRSFSILGAILLILPSVVAEEAAQPISLFDGKTLTGWKPLTQAGAKYWSVVDGVITGSNHGKKVPKNTWLVSEKSFGDFEFRCKFRITGDHETGL